MCELRSTAVPNLAAPRKPPARRLIASMRLPFVFLRYVGASLATGATDQVVFGVGVYSGMSVARGIVAARLLSSMLNLWLNRQYVFRSRADLAGTLLRYYGCMALNGALTYVLLLVARGNFGWPLIPAKITIELTLFLLSFRLSRTVIFRRESHGTQPF